MGSTFTPDMQRCERSEGQGPPLLWGPVLLLLLLLLLLWPLLCF
jgi:hypothetical protein